MKEYNYTRKIDFDFLEALDEIRFVFSEKWFGIVSTINVSERINKKLDAGFKNYTILWVCEPNLAYKFLSFKKELGVFMPCTVAVYEKDDWVYVSAWLPEVFLENEDFNEDLVNEINDLWKLLKSLIDSI